MKRSSWWRYIAAVTALALFAGACGNGEDEPEEEPDEGAEEPEEDPLADVEVAGWGDGVLTIGRVLPETGFLDYLGGPMVAGVRVAVDEINAAGGVFDTDVELLEFDSGTDPSVAVPNVGAALAEGADVILGAGASGVTQAFIETLGREGIYACSPSATSPAFVDQASAETFFRTVPPDEFVAPEIANEVVSDGNGENVVIAARSDDYGVALADLVAEEIVALGGSIAGDEPVIYTDETSFDAEATQIIGDEPSGVVVIGFREAGELLGRLVDGGLDPNTFYGADGIFSSQLPSIVGGADDIIDGMKVIGAAGTDEFNQRLADEGVADFLYGGQAYDCAILFALWAVAEGSDDVSEWDPDTLRGLTADGTSCSGFEDCATLLEDGEDIDYAGASGPLELVAGADGAGNLGNPSFSVYAVAQYQDGGTLTPVRSVEVRLN